MANILFSILSTFNDKGLKQATRQVSFFEKQIKSFGKIFAAAFSARALTNYSKQAVKAFMADEKAAKSLEQQLKNTGYQFSAPGVELYISNLQKATGVLDDELRPAFQQLLTVTGSITKSQEALNTALNISAATGKSLSEVSAALTRGYSGNTTGLSRLGAGLSKTLLKTGDMEKIMAELNDKFSGQSAARLSTYAGKMDQLTVASENAKEIIGKGLLDSLTLLSRDNSIKNVADDMEYFAQTIADAAFGMASLIKKLDKVTGLDKVSTETLLKIQNPLLYLASSYGSKQRPMAPLDANKQRSAGRIDAKRFQTEDKLAKAKAAELLLLQKKNALENKNVEELRKKFDVERIGLQSALNQATDEETKLKLRSLLAILDNNDAMAKKLLAEMEAAEALKKLAEMARLAAEALAGINGATIKYYEDLAKSLVGSVNYFGMTYEQILMERLREAGKIGLSSAPLTMPSAGPTYAPLPASYFQDLAVSLAGSPNYAGMSVSQIANERIRESGNRSVDVNLVVSSPSGDRFAQLMAESIQQANRSGYSTNPNGGLT
jgi:hypothetical protein